MPKNIGRVDIEKSIFTRYKATEQSGNYIIDESVEININEMSKNPMIPSLDAYVLKQLYANAFYKYEVEV